MVAAEYVQTELLRLEYEKEKRDRDFWSVMFGGEASESESDGVTLNVVEHDHRSPFPGTIIESDDDAIARSPLGRR